MKFKLNIKIIVNYSKLLLVVSFFSLYACNSYDSKYNQVLINAVLDSDLNAVKQAVDKGADINYISPKKNSISVGLAAKQGDYDIFKFLIENAAADKYKYIKLLRKMGYPILTAAVIEKCNSKIVKELLTLRKDFNINSDLSRNLGKKYESDYYGFNLIMIAATNCNYDVVEALIEYGGKIDYASVQGNTL